MMAEALWFLLGALVAALFLARAGEQHRGGCGVKERPPGPRPSGPPRARPWPTSRDEEDDGEVGCIHARPPGVMCPHCGPIPTAETTEES